MYIFLIILITILFSLTYALENKITLKIREHIVGFILYYILFSIVLVIIYDTPIGLSAVNDYFTSVLFIIGIIISFVIFLTNRNIISSNKMIDAINKIPEHIPFSHALKNYLLSLVKVNYKVKVLLRTIDNKNYIWTLNQIAAYNAIFKKDELDDAFKDSLEFIFLDNTKNATQELFKGFKVDRYNYIIVTSLSSIFKGAIEAREELIENKNRVKIIGALSSISDSDINKIIDNDDSIVRVFPPDYDEANTAMNFLFSRIVSSICINNSCQLYEGRSNIIILHNGTYGSAISRQCQNMFSSEQAGLKYLTNSLDIDKKIRDSINFYSFNYTSGGEFINDIDKNRPFKEVIKELSSNKNYFYLAGYEPNISLMLKQLNSVLNNDASHNNFLFCGTSSMYSWRKTIIGCVHSLKNIRNSEAYYLKLKHCNPNNRWQSSISSCNIKFKYKGSKKNINDILNEVKGLKIDLNQYCSLDENYISLLTQQSLKIAKEAIEHPDKSLVSAKYTIIHKDSDQKVDILFNGDSINQYTIEKMEKITNEKDKQTKK